MFYGHYDPEPDIAWIHLERDYTNVVSDEHEWGLRDVDRDTGELVGLEFWEASKRLPPELLELLPLPQAAVAE